jgi:hypothetical protein
MLPFPHQQTIFLNFMQLLDCAPCPLIGTKSLLPPLKRGDSGSGARDCSGSRRVLKEVLIEGEKYMILKCGNIACSAKPLVLVSPSRTLSYEILAPDFVPLPLSFDSCAFLGLQ